jgi:short-subunit dehydrogenase
MRENPFHENVTIITGASSGIGRELAYQLAEHGAWLVLGARDIDRLEAVAEVCRARGQRVLAIQTDVREETNCQRLVAHTVAEFGRIDSLINNAGITMWAPFEELHSLDPLEQIMQTNYFGSVYCTYYALPHLKESHGRLVAISSLAGKTGVPTRSGYAASKHALAGFFSTLRIELADQDLSVTVVYPDFVASEIRQRAFGPDGRPLLVSPVQEGKVMTAEACARLAIAGIAARKREVVMGRGRFLQYLLPFVPNLIDRIARKAIKEGK